MKKTRKGRRQKRNRGMKNRGRGVKNLDTNSTLTLIFVFQEGNGFLKTFIYQIRVYICEGNFRSL